MRGPRATRYAVLRDTLAELGEPSYRLTQILDAVHKNGILDYADMSALPRRLRDQLTEMFGRSVPELRPIVHQRGQQVEKVLFESPSGARVETVLSRYRSGFTSLCVSTQVGCGLGCTFCATGAVGLVRNLTADEICDQLLAFQEQVDSVAFMGMGEALANPHVFAAIETLTDERFFGLSARRISVSTVGFVPGLRRLLEEQPRVTPTLSVHSPYDRERATLVPLQHRYPLAESLELVSAHVGRTRRKAYLAYLLIDGVNDTEDHARALADLVLAQPDPRLLHVSVIPYNDAVGANPEYRRPRDERVHNFLGILRERDIHATRRQQFGGDLDAACGQLHATYLGKETRPRRRSAPHRATRELGSGHDH